jgi:hypothetical protein
MDDLTMNKHFDFELQKIIDTINSNFNLRFQLGIFFGTVNLTGIGVALSIENSIFVLLSALLMFLFGFVDTLIIRTIYACFYRAERIIRQHKYEGETIFDILSLSLRKEEIKRIKKISKMEDFNESLLLIRKLPLKRPTVYGFWIPFIVFLFEILLFISLFL